MTAKDEELRNMIAEQAADWFVANRTELSAREREEFDAWLKTSPVHVEEYLGLAVIARDLREACDDPESSVDSLVARAVEADPVRLRNVHWGRRPIVALTLAVFAVLSVALLAWWNFRVTSRAPASDTIVTLHFETGHGEQQTHRLPDKSVFHLNTDTSVNISYSKSERIVMLTSGEADFEVTHEPERPFRVFAGSAEVVDTGTQFDVRLNQNSTVVTVVEGRVAVGRSAMHAGSEFVELAADQQITVAQGVWPAAPVAVDAHHTESWLHRQITFDHEPLSRVAMEFNRYTSKPIEIATPALRDLEISGVFATDDPDAFIAFLRSLEGVRVEVTSTRIRVTRD